MTEIQKHQASTSSRLPGTPETRATGSDLIREAAAVMVDAKTLADAICGTSMVPAHFRDKPEECAAAILYGSSLGFDPMQSVKVIYVVKGNAALYATGMAAVVRRDGHDLRDVEVSDTSVTVAGRRAGSTEWVERTWTIERAKTAGYTSNAKYDTNPLQMLHAKATSEVCRVIAPDSLAGVYSVEERQMEYIDAEVVAVRRTAPPSKGLAAALDDKPPAAPAAPEPEAITKTQVATMGKLMKDVGVGDDKNMALAYVADVIGRQVERREDLTATEATAVIDALTAEVAAIAKQREAQG